MVSGFYEATESRNKSMESGFYEATESRNKSMESGFYDFEIAENMYNQFQPKFINLKSHPTDFTKTNKST